MNDLLELKDLSKDLTVLYAEDEESIRTSLEHYLKKLFTRVDAVEDGMKGLLLYKEGQYDLVITDIRMPKLDGIGMLSKIKEINPEQEMIVVSAYTDPAYFTEAIRLGVAGYIIKPVDYMQMNATLYRSLSKLHMIRENRAYRENLEGLVETRTREKLKLEEEKYENFEKTLQSLVKIIEGRDTYTGGHSQRVATYSSLIAEKMGYSPEECEILYRAGILHDIGKIVTPDTVLLKPGKLTVLEYKLIQEHITASYKMLVDIPMYTQMAEIIHHHHERYDGKGYPEGLNGEEIPMLSHIMITADAFDAMTTNRIYKGRKSVEEALEEMRSLSGIQFHPEVTKAALTALRDIQLPKVVSQIPVTEIEQERFAYFYNDQITPAYNQEYLNFILSSNYFSHEYSCINIVDLQHFTRYNETHGWSEGDKLLKRVADYLLETYAQSKLFRIHGDDFVLINPSHLEIDLESLEKEPWLAETGITLQNRHLDLKKQEVYDLKTLEMLL